LSDVFARREEMKKPILSIVLTLLMLTTLAFTFNVQKAKSTIRTVPTPYPTIQAAIDAASEGDTVYVAAGIYNESIIVWKRLILQGENKSTTIIDGLQMGDVVQVVANNVSISGFTITNSSTTPPGSNFAGVDIYYCDYVTLQDNNLTGNYNGIYMYDSNYDSFIHNTILTTAYAAVYAFYSVGSNFTDNTVTDSSGGIVIREGSHYTTILHNIVSSCSVVGIQIGSQYDNVTENTVINNDFGIKIFPLGTLNTFSHNNISLSRYDGLDLYGSNNNTFAENTFWRNRMTGIYVGVYYSQSSSWNIFVGNNITYNGGGASNTQGIYVDNSQNNTFCHNNFIGNTQSQVDSYNSINSWDNGYPSGGNYWSDYSGTDLYFGRHQNETGSDGIGDTSRIIDPENLDTYPLVSPWPQNHFRVDWTPTCPPPYEYSETPRQKEPVDIAASIMTNQKAPKTVMLSYRVNNGYWWNTTMSHDETMDLWKSTIPAQDGDSNVDFFVLACDTSGTAHLSPTYNYIAKRLLITDVNGDGKTDGWDIALVAMDFGKWIH
jgi:parallel beta-helix repeat protein